MVNNNNRKDHRNSTCYSCGKGFISPFAGELTMTRTPSVISIIHCSSPILVLFNIKSHQDWSYHTSIHGTNQTHCYMAHIVHTVLPFNFCRNGRTAKSTKNISHMHGWWHSSLQSFVYIFLKTAGIYYRFGLSAYTSSNRIEPSHTPIYGHPVVM